MALDTQLKKLIHAQPTEKDDPRHEWPGRTLQFVVLGCLEQQPIGFPSDIVEIVVPAQFPVAA